MGTPHLIINQVTGSWKIRSESLAPYQARIDEVAQFFDQVTYLHLPREENQFADALAKLAALINMPDNMNEMPLCIERRSEPAYIHHLTGDEQSSEEPWFQTILDFKLNGTYPPDIDKRGQRAIRLLASQYLLMQGELYKRTPLGVNLRCLDHSQAQKVMEEVHDGECGPHMSGPMMAKKITRLGYYWTTMESDCIKYVRHCHNCQIFGNVQHVPPSMLYTMTSPWPFSAWGIDIIGKITPAGTGGHCFILVAIDYFTKWVEAASYNVLNAKNVAKFIQTNIICRYGCPHEIISDNGSHFQAETEQLLAKYKIKHHHSSPYRPQTNGAVEAANKNVVTILKKMIDNYRDWPSKIPFALWGYRTSIRTPTGATPFYLTYGMEAVQPVELEIPSLRILLESQISEADWKRDRYDELVLLDERRLRALHNVQTYQARIKRAFNKRVKSRNIKEGDLVLKSVRALLPVDPRGKFKPNWSGPYLVKSIFSGGAVRITDLDGNEFSNPTNLDQLKRYYP